MMKKKIRKPIVLGFVAAVVVCGTVAVYGQDLYRVMKTVTLGDRATYEVVENSRVSVPIPEELQGQVFDKSGNALQVFPEDEMLYDKDGKQVFPVYDADSKKAKLVTKEEHDRMNGVGIAFTTKDSAEADGYFITDVLSPSYLPAGYAFDRAEFYGDPKTDPEAKKYIERYYTNGEQEISCQVRFMDDTTAYGSSTEEDIREVTINGNDAVVYGHSLDIQVGDVMYMFDSHDVSTDELAKIAESLQ